MGASELSSYFQCLFNLLLNVFTFGAFTTESFNSFNTLTILTVNDCLLFRFEPPYTHTHTHTHTHTTVPVVPSLAILLARN